LNLEAVASSETEIAINPTPAPIPTKVVKKVVAKNVTITCVKGKVLSTVTAIAPVCPKGYKKKFSKP